MGLFEIRETPWHQIFEEIPCLRGTILACQCWKIKRKSRYQGTRFALQIKIIHLCGLFAKHAQKFYCVTQRHRRQPCVSCLWGVETIIWKLPITPVFRIVSKYFETTGVIRTIIWKPGFRVWKMDDTQETFFLFCSLCKRDSMLPWVSS